MRGFLTFDVPIVMTRPGNVLGGLCGGASARLRGRYLSSALTILFPEAFHEILNEDPENAADRRVDVDESSLDDQWSVSNRGALTRAVVLARVTAAELGASDARVRETVLRVPWLVHSDRAPRETPPDLDLDALLRAASASPGAIAAKVRALETALLPKLRAEKKAALVVSSSSAALDAVAASLNAARACHFRLDGAPLCARLHAVSRFVASGGAKRASLAASAVNRELSVLLCLASEATDLTREAAARVDVVVHVVAARAG